MTKSDTSEKGLESRAIKLLSHNGWKYHDVSELDSGFCLYLDLLIEFFAKTQPKLVEDLELLSLDSPVRLKALTRITDEITRRGIIDVLRNGIKHNQYDITTYFTQPSLSNLNATQNFNANMFTVTRQVHFSSANPSQSLDLVLSINGFPIFTFELKNQLTRQNYADAILQYKQDRNPSELIFKFKRLVGHFAVDDSEAWFTTKLSGSDSWFLPFNRGHNDGAGNPVNPDGLKTDYLWQQVLLHLRHVPSEYFVVRPRLAQVRGDQILPQS
jgi:type I restriction enzyme R subunit